jgi:hypothetical protein
MPPGDGHVNVRTHMRSVVLAITTLNAPSTGETHSLAA